MLAWFDSQRRFESEPMKKLDQNLDGKFLGRHGRDFSNARLGYAKNFGRLPLTPLPAIDLSLDYLDKLQAHQNNERFILSISMLLENAEVLVEILHGPTFLVSRF